MGTAHLIMLASRGRTKAHTHHNHIGSSSSSDKKFSGASTNEKEEPKTFFFEYRMSYQLENISVSAKEMEPILEKYLSEPFENESALERSTTVDFDYKENESLYEYHSFNENEFEYNEDDSTIVVSVYFTRPFIGDWNALRRRLGLDKVLADFEDRLEYFIAIKLPELLNVESVQYRRRRGELFATIDGETIRKVS